MKLNYCTDSGDAMALRMQERSCICGIRGGIRSRWSARMIRGPAIPLGVANHLFMTGPAESTGLWPRCGDLNMDNQPSIIKIGSSGFSTGDGLKWGRLESRLRLRSACRTVTTAIYPHSPSSPLISGTAVQRSRQPVLCYSNQGQERPKPVVRR
jgi:hypothetical protein